jgi:hypothetical protein
MLRFISLITFVISLFLLSQNIWARGNPYAAGQNVLNPQLLQRMTRAEEIYKKTMGTPSWEAIQRAGGNFNEYITRRGVKSIAGKAFEARTAIRVNRFLANTGNDVRLVPTAFANAPHDPADLWAVDKAGNLLERFQLKLSGNAAIRALKDQKYAGMKIVVPSDQFKWIQSELNKEILKAQNRGKSLSPHWQGVRDAIDEKQLTSEIAGYSVPTRKQVEASGRFYTEKEFKKQWATMSLLRQGKLDEAIKLGKAAGKAGTSVRYLGQEIHTRLYKFEKGKVFLAFNKTGKPIAYGASAEEAIKKAKFIRNARIAGGIMFILGGVADIGSGIYSYHDTHQRYLSGKLDHDIMVGKKVVAVSRIGAGAGGVVVGGLLLFPEPVVTKAAAVVVGGVILVVNVTGLIADTGLERAQNNRTEHTKRLLKQIDWRTQQSICIESLKKTITQL